MPTASREIKRTQSRCPVCHEAVEARVVLRNGAVDMLKSCPTHGEFAVRLANDAHWYFESHGAERPTSAATGQPVGLRGGCCAVPGATDAKGSTVDPFEVLSTCIALIEIVDSCNLTCPTCYAGSPYGVGLQVDCTPFDRIVERVDGVVRRKGFIDILQLSGGEPTIHPEFERVLRWAVTNPGVGYVLVNTNLVRIAGDERFRRMLAEVRAQHGKFELYAQFDGVQGPGQSELRGADLRDLRERAIDAAGALGVPTTLAMVVDERTVAGVGDTLRWGIARPHVRGITFQPVFTSGRVAPVESRTLPVLAAPLATMGVGDVVRACAEQAPELLSARDFTPLPCGDPNCHTIAYLLRTDDGPIGMSRLLDLPTLQGFLENRVNYSLADLARCGCETEPLGELLKAFEIGPDKPFRIMIKPFMDAWTFDQDRIDRCCTHVVRQDGTLDSFCRYYLNGGRTARASSSPTGTRAPCAPNGARNADTT